MKARQILTPSVDQHSAPGIMFAHRWTNATADIDPSPGAQAIDPVVLQAVESARKGCAL
jgi:hypothetical protein